MNKQLVLALSVGLLAGFVTAYVLLTPDLMYLARFADPHTSGEMEGMEGPLIGICKITKIGNQCCLLSNH